MRLLLVEDDVALQTNLKQHLLEAHYSIDVASDGEEGLFQAVEYNYDAAIIDVGLPKLDGISLIRRIRQKERAFPILILTARDSWQDKVEGLDAGADDYLTKPFGVDECLARIRVLLRRHAGHSARNEQTFRFGDVRVDLVQRQVLKAEQAIHLTPIEYRLLATLIRHAGKVMTQRELLREVWGPNHSESSQYLRVYMGHLRQKLESDPALPQHLLTETGVGYRLLA